MGPGPACIHPDYKTFLKRANGDKKEAQRRLAQSKLSQKANAPKAPARKPAVSPGKFVRREPIPRGPATKTLAPPKAFREKLTSKDVASLYEAFPGAFDPVPRLACEGIRDAFVPRGTVRVKFMYTDSLPSNILYYMSPSPLAVLSSSGTQWLGAYTCPITSSTNYLANTTDVWVNKPASLGADKIDKTQYMNTTMTPTMFGSPDQPISLCGGFACLTVTVPYNGQANVYAVGPTDCSTQQGILTGDWWRKVSAANIGGIEPRRQCWRSADFHGNNNWQVIKSVLNPIPLVGSSESAQKYFGFAIVPDNQFTAMTEVPIANNFPTPVDYYPSGNAMSGPSQGQGSFYIENTGGVPLQVKIEVYMDFCVSVSEVTQRYVGPESLATGPQGIEPHPITTAQFPGLMADNCPDLLYKIMTTRLPAPARKRAALSLAKTLVTGYFAKASSVSSTQAKLVQSTLSCAEAAAKSVGVAAEHVAEDIVTDIEHPVQTVENMVSTVASVAKKVWDVVEDDIL